MSERVFVTGAAGFIGGHTCAALLRSGLDVVGVDNFDLFYDRRIKERTIQELSLNPAFTFHEADIRDGAAMRGFTVGADVVIHLAARAGVRPSIADPALYTSVNVDGTVQLLEACVGNGVARFVFGSSSSVYGDDTPVPFVETVPAMCPISPYAATKRAAELICDVYRRLYDVRVASLRLFTVYGPRQRPDLAIHRFTKLLALGSPIQRYGDGSSERDYTHIDDILKGILAAVEWTRAGGSEYEIFNLGESCTVWLDYLIELIAGALGTTPEIESLPPQAGDVRRTFADISKARKVLGYDPSVTIEDGILDFVDWFRTANEDKSTSLA
ncbi:MAG: NAD-dependent epimerase/dehydratase family protein [Gemmatimonadales bacterium]